MEISHGFPLFLVKEDVGPDFLHDLHRQLWRGGLPLGLGSVFLQEVTPHQGGTTGPACLAVDVHTSSLGSAGDVRDELHSPLEFLLAGS